MSNKYDNLKFEDLMAVKDGDCTEYWADVTEILGDIFGHDILDKAYMCVFYNTGYNSNDFILMTAKYCLEQYESHRHSCGIMKLLFKNGKEVIIDLDDINGGTNVRNP